VPVITLPGDRHVARVGASLLHAVGHAEWIATDGDDYVRRAVELAGNLPHLAATRAGLRADLQRSALLDHAGQAARFAAAIRECWQTWCASQAGDRRAATIQAAPATVSA
jgi:predicted O-linked N-acetylglucosamine transferase (SPINDLY family)